MMKSIVAKNPEKYPSRLGEKWDTSEVQKLLKSIQAKKSIPEIAKEHERTEGGIRAELNKLAGDYWFYDKRPIDEIQKFTGLDKEHIEAVIQKRQSKESKTINKPNTKPAQQSVPSSHNLEVVDLLKEINDKLSLIIERLSAPV